MARIAIDAYLASLEGATRSDVHDRFHSNIRALNLATMIRDAARQERAKIALLTLHRSEMNADRGLWWMAFDRLIDDTASVRNMGSLVQTTEGCDLGLKARTGRPDTENRSASARGSHKGIASRQQ